MMIDRGAAFIIEMGILFIYAIIMLIRKVKFKKFVLNLAFGFYISVIIALCLYTLHPMDLIYQTILFRLKAQ